LKFIYDYFPNLNRLQKQQLESLFEHYKFWNAQINVISRKDMDYFYLHHVLHSLSIAKFISFKNGSKILDVGTGGGFPGVPLSILFPDVEFHLVDSIGKKIKVIDAIKEKLDLKNIFTHHERMENMQLKVDFVVCRAVAPMETLMHWSADKISHNNRHAIKNGFLCLKGGDLQKELSDYQSAIVVPLKDYYRENFFETKKLVYCSLD
jgi:16S rRNA (guanine527-N7)-methyltransferase